MMELKFSIDLKKEIGPAEFFNRLENANSLIGRSSDYFWNDNGTTNKDAFNLKSFETKTLVTIFLDRFGVTTSIGKLKNPD